MPLRGLLNAAYAAMVGAEEDIDKLDHELEVHPDATVGVGRSTGDVTALMNAGRMGGRKP